MDPENDTKLPELMGQIPLEDQFRGLGAVRSVANRLIHAMARYLPMYPGWRVSLHRLRGVSIGRGVFIGSDVFIDNTYPDSIIIEDYVTIISRTFIIGHSFIPRHLERAIGGHQASPRPGVVLKKGCYVGAQCVILPGVLIGECAVVGAGSVVAHDIPAFSVAMGSPAKVTRSIMPEDVQLERRD